MQRSFREKYRHPRSALTAWALLSRVNGFKLQAGWMGFMTDERDDKGVRLNSWAWYFLHNSCQVPSVGACSPPVPSRPCCFSLPHQIAPVQQVISFRQDAWPACTWKTRPLSTRSEKKAKYQTLFPLATGCLFRRNSSHRGSGIYGKTVMNYQGMQGRWWTCVMQICCLMPTIVDFLTFGVWSFSVVLSCANWWNLAKQQFWRESVGSSSITLAHASVTWHHFVIEFTVQIYIQFTSLSTGFTRPKAVCSCSLEWHALKYIAGRIDGLCMTFAMAEHLFSSLTALCLLLLMLSLEKYQKT